LRFWHAFDDWIDWDWQPWLERVYADSKDSITDHMRSVWLPVLKTVVEVEVRFAESSQFDKIGDILNIQPEEDASVS
jgi:hypothetical protein